MTITNTHESNTSKNPFDCESSEDEHENHTSISSNHATPIRSTGNWRFFTPFSSASVTKSIVESAVSSPSLFPASLSQWDTHLHSTDNVNDDETLDEGSFHDCLSKADTMDEEETSPPLLGQSDGGDPTRQVSLRLSPKTGRNGASPKRSFFDTVAAVAIGSPILDNCGKDDDAVTDAMDVDEHSRLLPGTQATIPPELAGEKSCNNHFHDANNYGACKMSPIDRHRGDGDAENGSIPVARETPPSPTPNDPNSHLVPDNVTFASPLREALTTWLSPYARSARRAGRRSFLFSPEDSVQNVDGDGNDTGACCDDVTERTTNVAKDEEIGLRRNLKHRFERANKDDVVDNDGNEETEEVKNERAVSFTPVTSNNISQPRRNSKRSNSARFLQKVYSSPALMTTPLLNDADSEDGEGKHSTKRSSGLSNLYGDSNGNETPRSTGIVLKEIEVEGENSYSDYGAHPWTKLILLEELGTASSWIVLLLPYVSLILAMILDGYPQLKNVQVGPLYGNMSCADINLNAVATPYDVSAKGYYPVPFTISDKRLGDGSTDSCSYAFELRENVGLLFCGETTAVNADETSRSSSIYAPTQHETSSIIDARYRYLMSHGYAFTSGVIFGVPATSQSLQGSATFKHLSNRAVALVARGSVLVSAIVFQRKSDPTIIGSSLNDNNASREDSKVIGNEWSPVLILTPKKLDMTCKLNEGNDERMDTTNSKSGANLTEPITWDCTSHRIIDAFFSLPNTAVLIGGNLRVDVLLSHHTPRQPLTDDIWFDGGDGMVGLQDDYFSYDGGSYLYQSKAEKILSTADIQTAPEDLLAELSQKSAYMLEHESESYSVVVEVTRIIALVVTLVFLCYWSWSMRVVDSGSDRTDIDINQRRKGISSLARDLIENIANSWKRRDDNHSLFWWESPWMTFPERRYLLILLICLMMLQNPLLAYAFFHPSLYSSAKFRCAADSLSGVSVHGILFFWLCLVNGLRYHTADSVRRRFNQQRRVLELCQAVKHVSTLNNENSQWARVRWYYKQYGDDGPSTSSLKLKHDIGSDSFVEFMLPKFLLLIVGTGSTITAAMSRFPLSENDGTGSNAADFLNPDRFGRGSKVYVASSIIQLIVIQTWGIFIIYNSFITGGRLRREPFLSTRPAQLAFRVLSAILLLGVGFSTTLFLIRVFGSSRTVSTNGSGVTYDTSLRSSGESWESMADILFGILRYISTTIPYSDTALSIGPGKVIYATSCSLIVAYIFLPSRTLNKEEKAREDKTIGSIGHSKHALMVRDKKLQGKDKRFVVTLARKTHTWRVFPLPIRVHGLMSQHTIKEKLNLIGSFQLDGNYNQLDYFGRGSIFKGRYSPIFCVEIACWLLEASWQAYYSATTYSLNQWAPGRMRLDSIGLRLESAIDDEETDTHAFVASNISEQIEGEEDSIIVISFRGTASISNMKTDLTFRQVPLNEKIISNTAAFNILPGKPMHIEENAWDLNESITESLMRGIFSPQRKSPHPTSSAHGEGNQNIMNGASLLLPSVSSGAKAIIRATPMARQALPCVHEGFLQNYSKVRRQLIEAILAVLKRQVDKALERCKCGIRNTKGMSAEPFTLPKIYITGHSLGGSLAQLLALDLASNCEILIEQSQKTELCRAISNPSQSSFDNEDDDATSESSDAVRDFWLGGQSLKHPDEPAGKVMRLCPPIAVYSYGQPRVGNTAFKNIYKQRVPHTFRVVTEGDAFTAMPTFGPCCGGIYRHAGLEVLLDEGCTGNILVGPTVVETMFRFTKMRTSVAAHSMERYRESLESALGRDELKEYYHGHGGKASHDDRRHHSGYNDSLPSWVTNVKRSHDQRY